MGKANENGPHVFRVSCILHKVDKNVLWHFIQLFRIIRITFCFVRLMLAVHARFNHYLLSPLTQFTLYSIFKIQTVYQHARCVSVQLQFLNHSHSLRNRIRFFFRSFYLF